MRKNPLSSLLLALLASVSLGVSAAPSAGTVEAVKPAVTQSVQAAVTGVDLNTADEATLERELQGVGPGKARAIVEYRKAHGPFASVDELLEVKGIGAATLEKNRERLHAE